MRMTSEELRKRLIGKNRLRIVGKGTMNVSLEKPKRLKFGNKPVTVDGKKFDSGKQADYYGELKLRLKAGDIRWFTPEPLFILPGNTHFHPDFMFQEIDGTVRVVDIKAIDAKTGKIITKGDGFAIRCRQLKEIYGLEVEIV